METVIKRQMFSLKGRDVFHISMVHGFDTQQYYLSSSLPEWLVNKHKLREIAVCSQAPFYNLEEVGLALNELGLSIQQDPYTKHFYYPSMFLDSKGKHRPEVSLAHRHAIADFQIKRYPFISVIDKPHESLFLTFKLLDIRFNNSCYVFADKLKRKTFERNLEEEHQKSDYVDLFYKIKSFIRVEVNNISANMPSFQAGLDEKGEVLIAFVDHSYALVE